MLRHILLFLHNTDQLPFFTEFIDELTAADLPYTLYPNEPSAFSGLSEVSPTDCLAITDSDTTLSALSGRIPTIGLQNPSIPGQSLFSAYALLESLESADSSYLKRIHAHKMHYPAIIAKTDRLLIREFSFSDVDALFQLRSDPENNRYLFEKTASFEEEKDKLYAYITEFYPFSDFALWGLFDRRTDILLGQAGFSVTTDLSSPEFGYMLDLSVRRQGLATEAAAALLSYAKDLGMEHTLIRIHPDNTPSLRVLSSCGFPYHPVPSDSDILLFQIDLIN